MLRGDRIQISDYELVMGQDEVCKHLCDREVNRGAVERAKELVRGGYVIEWWVLLILPGDGRCLASAANNKIEQ